MTVYADLQKLDAGAQVEIFALDDPQTGDVLALFHGYTQIGPIYWQGVTYQPWPIDATGFQMNPTAPPVPHLTVGNVDGSITALCLAYDDLVGARLTRHRTFGKYLDAANFPGGNPTADPSQELPPDVWFIERKAAETKTGVDFELSSALDFGQVQLPGRAIVANVCGWLARGGYRGPYCGYTGPAVAKADDTPTADPAQDVCGGRLASCRLRFGDDAPLPYGSFPAAGLLRQ